MSLHNHIPLHVPVLIGKRKKPVYVIAWRFKFSARNQSIYADVMAPRYYEIYDKFNRVASVDPFQTVAEAEGWLVRPEPHTIKFNKNTPIRRYRAEVAQN